MVPEEEEEVQRYIFLRVEMQESVIIKFRGIAAANGDNFKPENCWKRKHSLREGGTAGSEQGTEDSRSNSSSSTWHCPEAVICAPASCSSKSRQRRSRRGRNNYQMETR